MGAQSTTATVPIAGDRDRTGPNWVSRPGAGGLFLALAPMDGVTDHGHRALATTLDERGGGISLCVSEFVRVTDRQVSDRVLLRHCPELARGGRTRGGVPVFVQLLGGGAAPMAATARRASELGAPGIDINFGCPAKRVNNHDGGASILRSRARVENITAQVRAAVPDQVPVTVKIRLGWDDASQVEDLARAVEAGGASWLTIHGRTRTQMYRPPVDWEAIGRARAAVNIPVVANGDLNGLPELRRCAELSGCEAFMIGRGALARPDIFQQLRDGRDAPLNLARYATVLLRYVDELKAAGHPPDATLRRLKQWLNLSVGIEPTVRQIFDPLKRDQDLPVATARLEALVETDASHRRQAP